MSTTHENERTGPRPADPSAPVRRPGPPRGPAGVLALQRAAGNRAVAGALQRGALKPAGAVAVPVPGAASDADVAVAAAPETAPATGPGKAVQRGWLDDIASSARRTALEAVSNYAKRMPGYDLLCTVLGKDVISDAPVPRTAAKIIDGFLALIPGADRIRQNLQESGATAKAGQWLEEEVPKLGLTWEAIQALFKRAWDALDVTDLADPAGAFAKLRGIFGGPIGRLRDFALAAGKKLLEFVFEGAMTLAGGAGGAVMGIIKRAGGVFDQIVANPMGFLSNLVNAVRGGLGAFLTNIWTHLKNGLVAWLTGGLGGVIRIPEKFDLKGILGMALDFLGLTWAKVKGKLGRLIGNDTLDLLEKGVDKLQQGAGFVGDLFKRGLSAITERIAEFATGLVGQVMDGIKDWVAKSVVGAAITKLISMFNPAGAVIQAIIAIYNTVQFFIERGKQIASLASAVFDSISEIASGNIGRAVSFVEQALARAVPVVLGFLARLIGLGDIATPVKNVMTKVHTVVDQALDKAMAWVARVGAPVINLVKRVAGRIRAGMDAARAWVRGGVASVHDRLTGRGQRNQQLEPAVRDAHSILRAPGATVASARAGLADLRRRHSLRSADVVSAPGAPGAFQIVVQRDEAKTPPVPVAGAAAQETPGHAKDAGGAILVGRVGTYSSLAGAQDPRRGAHPMLELYREHVIPRQLVGHLMRALQGPGVPRQGSDYAGMVTVLLYNSAKAAKDGTDPKPDQVDAAVAAARTEAAGAETSAAASRGRQASASGAHYALLRVLQRLVGVFADASAGSAVAAATADNAGAGGAARGTTSNDHPTAAAIQSAVRQQKNQVDDLLMEAAEDAAYSRDEPEDLVAIANELATRWNGSRSDTHGGYATDFPLGLRGGTGSGKAVVTFTGTTWTISARGRTLGPTPFQNRAGAVAAIGAEIDRLRAEEAGEGTFTDQYRSVVVNKYAAGRRADRTKTQDEVATAVVAWLGTSPAELAGERGRSDPPAARTIIEWARERNLA